MTDTNINNMSNTELTSYAKIIEARVDDAAHIDSTEWERAETIMENIQDEMARRGI